MIKLIGFILLFSTSLIAKDLKVLTSFYPVQIMALNIFDGVSGVEVKSLVKPMAGCLHDYSPSPREIAEIYEADIFIANGLGMESFLERVLKEKKSGKIFVLSNGYKPLIERGVQNPHLFVSLSGMIFEVTRLRDLALKEFPEQSEKINTNAKRYLDELKTLSERFKVELAFLKDQPIITFHEAFAYFASELQMRPLAVIEREPGETPSAKAMSELIKVIRKEKIKVLFTEPQYSAKSADLIVRETGIMVRELDPAVTGPLSRNAYLKAMEQNLMTLKSAYQK